MATQKEPKKKLVHPSSKGETAPKTTNGKKKYTCVCCGGEYTARQNHFMKNTSSKLYKYNDDYVPICNNCLNALYDDCIVKYSSAEIATVICCSAASYPFIQEVFSEAIGTYSSYKFNNYVSVFNKRHNKDTMSYINTAIESRGLTELGLRRANKEKDWSEEEHHNRDQVIKILGYDPFSDYQDSDRRYLFTEFLKYLDDDELLDDTYKMSQILQLVNNNNQIKQCDMAISLLDPIRNMEDFKNLTSLKANLVTSNDKIAKENRISVKNREGNSGGKGTVTGLMREMRDKEINEIAANYYKQLDSPSSRWAAEVSAKALKENCFFDENDLNEMLYEQRDLILKLQEKNDKLTEENRTLRQNAFLASKDGEQD